ncbi:type I restriction enzyme S subunit [Pedobacter sp. CG_S7]|uniref:restriction endonuclease subunit S n=1 Tax=Pedobacter sp. CG_S7 TaxID=3143930 RepID=UPI0033963B2E
MREGWEISTLGEIGKASMCKRIFKEQTSYSGDIPFFKIGTFGKEPDAFISNEIYNDYRKRFSFPKNGDILISASGTIGRCVRYDGKPAYFQDSNIVWIDNNEKKVLNDYLYRFYEICNWRTTKGATISRLYNGNLKQIEIVFPKSLTKQQQIVAILDETFAIIAKAKANAQQNLKNAKELFDSYLQSVFKNANWETKKIREVCDEIFAGGDAPKNNFSLEKNEKHQIPIYANAVKDSGFYGYTDSARVKKPSITISARGSGTGHTEIRFKNYLPIVRLIVLIPNFSLINLEFLKHSIDNLEIIRSGSAIPQLTVPMIKEYNLPLPSLKEQDKIVANLDALSVEIIKLDAIYKQKINDLEELKKSILRKAFAGELTEKEIAV